MTLDASLKYSLLVYVRENILPFIDKVDWNGHFSMFMGNYLDLIRDITSSAVPLLECLSPVEVQELQRFLNNPDSSLSFWITLNSWKPSCIECGLPLTIQTNGEIIRMKEGCLYPEGYPEWFTEIDVPSGRLFVAEDLMDFFPEAKKVTQYLKVDVNPEVHRFAQEFAYEGALCGYIGNSTPGIYRRLDERNTLIIGLGVDDEPIRGTEYLGNISTNLWWYFAADLVTLRKNGMRFTREPDKSGCICKVSPGRYRATYYHHLIDIDDYTEDQEFVWIERMGQCNY